MTEPSTGSDLAAISTTAHDRGDHYVVNGSKVFVSNGMLADFVIVAVSTDRGADKRGISLLIFEDGMPGFSRTSLRKIGMAAQDTAELVFDNVTVPKANVLGAVGEGFVYLRQNLPQERLSVAVASMASARAAIVFEPRANGRIYERSPSGEEKDWGTVLHWEPRIAWSTNGTSSPTPKTQLKLR